MILLLSQSEIDYLIDVLKKFIERDYLSFPSAGEGKTLKITSLNEREEFLIDINRKGNIDLKRCTLQKRYRKEYQLLRLDISGPPHTNPDGNEIPCPHLHIYKEGYGTAWAYPLPEDVFTNLDDFILTFTNFLEYCKVINIEYLTIQGGFLS